MKTNFFLLFLLVSLLGCNRSAENATEEYRETNDAAESSEAPTGLVSSDLKSTYATAADSTVVASATDETEIAEDKTKDDLSATLPKLIKSGFLTIEVENYKAYRKYIAELVAKHGGYLGNESESNETYRITNDLIIRIPVKSFELIMSGLAEQGLKTDSKRIEVQDVGEEYADLQARIRAKQAVEKRYLDILNKATKISDILEVEEKLRVIREETEAAQGRVKFLENQATFSTINLSFYKVLDTHYTPPSGPGFLSRIWKGLVKGWENVLEFIVGLAYLWPLWLVLIAAIIMIRRSHLKWTIWPFRKKQP